MLTIQPYRNQNYQPSFGAKASTKNVKDLSDTSQKLLRGFESIFKKPELEKDTYRSRRFVDGSYMEIAGPSANNNCLNIKFVQCNKRPVVMDIDSKGDITGNFIKNFNLNYVIEKYLPDILKSAL